MKYIDLFKAYLKDFIYFASTFINHYLTYKPKENIDRRNNNSHFEVPNNTYALSISELMPFPPSIFEVIENDNNTLGSLDSSGNLDYDLINGGSIFTSENSIFQRDNYL